MLLASSKLCKNQAFRFKNKLFGFQYHLEATPEIIQAMIAQGKDDINKVPRRWRATRRSGRHRKNHFPPFTSGLPTAS